MKKRVELNKEEQITLQTLIVRQIKKNEEYEKRKLNPCFKTEDLKNLYQKIAGYEYGGW